MARCRIELCWGRICAKHTRTLEPRLRGWLRDARLADAVEVVASGCFDRCEQGPNVRLDDATIVHGVDFDRLRRIVADAAAAQVEGRPGRHQRERKR